MSPATVADPVAIEEVFGRVPLLARLNDRQRSRMAQLSTTRLYEEGSIIVRQGDTSMALYVVLSGRARIDRESEAGKTVQVDEVTHGGFFGEMGLIEDMPRAATVIAEQPTECALLAKWDFQNELRTDPDIALALLPVLGARIRELDDQLVRLHHRS
jgi:CRP/FNR family cyclic AMP-dependent transcriptional regulator